MHTPELTILIVEDEPKIAALLRDYLHDAGYATHWVSDGSAALGWIRNNAPSLVLLDLQLPGKSGLTVCRETRAFTQVPIIILTAKVEEIDRLLGLELGADDYICKPFSPREVVARIKAVLRRTQLQTGEAGALTRYNNISIDTERFRASIEGKALELTPVEFRLLQTLLSQPGRVFSRDQLMDKVYTDGRIVSDRTLDSHVKNLRHKIDRLSPDKDVIQSVYGVGYRLE